MAAKAEEQNGESLLPEPATAEDPGRQDEDDADHLEKMTDYKSYCKGLMDVALLTANANQLRHTLEICEPYRALLVVLLSISILLQVVASLVLLVERMTCRKKDFATCHKYNAAIGCLTIIVIIVNILATAFGGPDNDCTPNVSALE